MIGPLERAPRTRRRRPPPPASSAQAPPRRGAPEGRGRGRRRSLSATGAASCAAGRTPPGSGLRASPARTAPGLGRGISSTTLEVTFGGGVKAAGATSNRIRASRPPPRQHREAAVIGALGRGRDDPAGDLALEHERQPVIERRPRLGLEPADEQRRRDVIGQVGRDPERRAAGLVDERRRRDARARRPR